MLPSSPSRHSWAAASPGVNPDPESPVPLDTTAGDHDESAMDAAAPADSPAPQPSTILSQLAAHFCNQCWPFIHGLIMCFMQARRQSMQRMHMDKQRRRMETQTLLLGSPGAQSSTTCGSSACTNSARAWQVMAYSQPGACAGALARSTVPWSGGGRRAKCTAASTAVSSTLEGLCRF